MLYTMKLLIYNKILYGYCLRFQYGKVRLLKIDTIVFELFEIRILSYKGNHVGCIKMLI